MSYAPDDHLLSFGAKGHARSSDSGQGGCPCCRAQLSRFIKVHPEDALRAAGGKFERRFRLMEKQILEAGEDIRTLDAAALDERWERAKRG